MQECSMASSFPIYLNGCSVTGNLSSIQANLPYAAASIAAVSDRFW